MGQVGPFRPKGVIETALGFPLSSLSCTPPQRKLMAKVDSHFHAQQTCHEATYDFAAAGAMFGTWITTAPRGEQRAFKEAGTQPRPLPRPGTAFLARPEPVREEPGSHALPIWHGVAAFWRTDHGQR